MEGEAEFTTRRNLLVPSQQYKLMLFKVCCMLELSFSLYQIYTDNIVFIDEKAGILFQVYTDNKCIPGGGHLVSEPVLCSSTPFYLSSKNSVAQLNAVGWRGVKRL